jgi:hypothetical protein
MDVKERLNSLVRVGVAVHIVKDGLSDYSDLSFVAGFEDGVEYESTSFVRCAYRGKQYTLGKRILELDGFEKIPQRIFMCRRYLCDDATGRVFEFDLPSIRHARIND